MQPPWATSRRYTVARNDHVTPPSVYWQVTPRPRAPRRSPTKHGSGDQAANIARSDTPAEVERHEFDFSGVLVGIDPRLRGITQSVVDNVRAIVGASLDRFLILWLDPVDFVLADSQGMTSEHTSGRNVDGAPGAIHVGNDFSELLVIPNAPADVYTLELVGLGGEFRGEAIFVEGNSFRSAPLQGLLGSGDRLVAQIDFRNDTSTPFFTPPLFGVAQQSDPGGGVFAVDDPIGDDTQAVTSNESSSASSALGLADSARGSRRRGAGGDNWIEWLFERLRRAIDGAEEGAEEEAEEGDEKPADDEGEEENESTDPLGGLNFDADSQSTQSAPAKVVDDEPAGRQAETDVDGPIGHVVATDAAMEEMEASAAALMAVGLVRDVAGSPTGRRRLGRRRPSPEKLVGS
ncbi:MAG: hypothetical protein IIA67_14240 [Planctomycetes bacterium]|nr:hypothetical protein [Planctomycetota bacterium]